MTQKTLTPSTNAINLSFHQKSTLLALIITSGTTAYYFATMWPMRPIALATETIPAGYGDLVMTALTLLIGTQLLLHLLLKLTNGSEISSQAKRNAYILLTLGMLAAVGSVFLEELTSFCTANLALLGFALAQNVKLATQLFYTNQ